MANFNQPFGSAKVTKTVDDNAVGGVTTPVAKVETKKEDTSAPKGRNKELWAAAEHSALNQTGGFGGTPKDKRDILIQEHYDQLIANDKKLKEGFSGILGDV